MRIGESLEYHMIRDRALSRGAEEKKPYPNTINQTINSVRFKGNRWPNQGMAPDELKSDVSRREISFGSASATDNIST